VLHGPVLQFATHPAKFGDRTSEQLGLHNKSHKSKPLNKISVPLAPPLPFQTMMTLSNPPDANAPTAPSLGADVEMLNNQLTVSSNNHPPLTVVTAATAAASGDMGVAFATAVEGIVDVDVIATANNATVFPAPPSEFSIQEVSAATAEQFQVGMCYDSEHIL